MGLHPATVSSRHHAKATSGVAVENAQWRGVRPEQGYARQAAAQVSDNNIFHVRSSALTVRRLAITRVTVAIARAVASVKDKRSLKTRESAALKAARPQSCQTCQHRPRAELYRIGVWGSRSLWLHCQRCFLCKRQRSRHAVSSISKSKVVGGSWRRQWPSVPWSVSRLRFPRNTDSCQHVGTSSAATQ